MPELPNVESFKRHFKKTGLNKKIIDIESSTPELIKKISFKDLKQRLIGRSFENAFRRGKFLIIKVKGISERLIVHFGMAGNLHYVKQGEERKGEDRFTRLCFEFANGYELRWINRRKLGKIYLTEPKKIKLIEEMGPEPLELSECGFLKLLTNYKQKNLKAFLMDQRNIAGIGNIYSDEILFQAKISPQRKIEDLTQKEKRVLFQKTRYVLTKATNFLISLREFPKSWLEPHRHTDRICPRNKNHKLSREIIGGRPAIFCHICQK